MRMTELLIWGLGVVLFIYCAPVGVLYALGVLALTARGAK